MEIYPVQKVLSDYKPPYPTGAGGSIPIKTPAPFSPFAAGR